MEQDQEIYSKYCFQFVLQNKNTLNEMQMCKFYCRHNRPNTFMQSQNKTIMQLAFSLHSSNKSLWNNVGFTGLIFSASAGTSSILQLHHRSAACYTYCTVQHGTFITFHSIQYHLIKITVNINSSLSSYTETFHKRHLAKE
jgi:hypothetical protein